MKYTISLLYIFILLSTLNAQDYHNQRFDRQRMIIDILTAGCPSINSSDSIRKVGTLIDFNYDTPHYSVVDTFYLNESGPKYWQYVNNAQICNNEGIFTAFYNGQFLFDRYGNKDELTMFKDNPFGYPTATWHNRSVILPIPQKDSFYILFTPTNHVNDPNYDVVTATNISGLIFRELSNGRLKIINILPNIIEGKYCPIGTLSAVRHANGRDWWIIAPQRLKPNIQTFLYSHEGVIQVNNQQLSDTTADFSVAPEFSPDGQWYTRTNVRTIGIWKKISTVQFNKFNRCSGSFEHQITFDLEYEDTSNVVQVIFEKNSRYFYIMNTLTIYQGDIEATDIKGSLIKIATSLPLFSGNHMAFGAGFLGPDDKIHVFDGRPIYYGSTINRPSERGLSCDFIYESILYPACTSISFGNMPNFNLGPLDGSACDTLGLDFPYVDNPDEKEDFKLFPSPTNDIVYGKGNVLDQNLNFKIFDIYGKVHNIGKSASLKSGINLSSYSSGVYFVSIDGLRIKKVVKL